MHSLELRRLHVYVICCNKIVFALVDVACDDFFLCSVPAPLREGMHTIYP